jgi:hypothetical protein
MDWILGGVDNALGRVINTFRTTYFFRVKLIQNDAVGIYTTF